MVIKLDKKQNKIHDTNSNAFHAKHGASLGGESDNQYGSYIYNL